MTALVTIVSDISLYELVLEPRLTYTPVVRLSFGPKMDVLKKGLDGIERVVKK